MTKKIEGPLAALGALLAFWVGVANAGDFAEDYSEFAALKLPNAVRARLETQSRRPEWAGWMRNWNDTFVDPPVEADCAADLTDATFFRRRVLTKALTITSWGNADRPPPAWALRNLGLMIGLAMHHGSRLDLSTMDDLLDHWVRAVERESPGLDVDRFLGQRAQLAPFQNWVASLGELGRLIEFGPGSRAN